MSSVRAVAPAKINLSLRVRALRPDGYHEITTVFHAVSLADEVTVTAAPAGAGRSVTTTGERAGSVPRGDDNIAAQAAVALAHYAGLADPDVTIEISKSIPVAAGMAGGSADAAATLVALKRLWSLDLTDADLAGIAAQLGSDVPFSLMGGTARGIGRGEVLTPVLTDGDLHWVVAMSDTELSTPAVYAEWDRLLADGLVSAAGEPDRGGYADPPGHAGMRMPRCWQRCVKAIPARSRGTSSTTSSLPRCLCARICAACSMREQSSAPWPAWSPAVVPHACSSPRDARLPSH